MKILQFRRFKASSFEGVIFILEKAERNQLPSSLLPLLQKLINQTKVNKEEVKKEVEERIKKKKKHKPFKSKGNS